VDTGVAARLAGLSEGDQERLLLDLVRTSAAAALGASGSGTIQPEQAFKDVGFDSLAAVDLRNRLATAVDVRLPATLIFDFPTPAALGRYLREQLAPAARPAVLTELDRLEKAFVAEDTDEATMALVAARLKVLVAQWDPAGAGEFAAFDLDTASDDEIFELAEHELGLA
jgi:acyl carrier protein